MTTEREPQGEGEGMMDTKQLILGGVVMVLSKKLGRQEGDLSEDCGVNIVSTELLSFYYYIACSRIMIACMHLSS